MTTPYVKDPVRDDSGLSRDETGTPDLPQESQAVVQARTRTYRKDHEPSVDRGLEPTFGSPSDSDQLRDATQKIARNAWIAFKDACEATELDQQESNLLAARSSLDDLWNYAKHRDVPFRDLLGILTAATKYIPLESFSPTQRDVLRGAFYDLQRWLLDEDTVMGHIEKFAEYDIDITGPIRTAQAKKIRITIEEVD